MHFLKTCTVYFEDSILSNKILLKYLFLKPLMDRLGIEPETSDFESDALPTALRGPAALLVNECATRPDCVVS